MSSSHQLGWQRCSEGAADGLRRENAGVGLEEVEHEYYAARNSGSHQSNGSQKLGAGGAIERKKFPEEPGDLQNAYKVSINHFFISVFFNHFRFT